MFKWFVFVVLLAFAFAEPEAKPEAKPKASVYEGSWLGPQYYGGGYIPYGNGYGGDYGWGYPSYGSYPYYSDGYWPQYNGYYPHRQW